MIDTLIERLNAEKKEDRLSAIQKLSEMIKNGKIPQPKESRDVNNHVHTIYSFSPYSPSKAIWMGYISGLKTIGIMDHDSISGAEEFIEAANIIGIAATVGFETRVKMNKTPLNGKNMNNPDQKDIAYIAFHGIPHTQISIIKEFFKPIRNARIERDKKMIDNINKIMEPNDIFIDFDKDVIPLSMYSEGGSITERHLLYALTKKILSKYSKGSNLVDFLKNNLKINLSSKVEEFLLDKNNPYYEYDILGTLKSELVSKFYIDATDECLDVHEFVELANKTKAIMAYPYLGDITNSVTGDKKAQKFEDDYIDLLFDTIKNIGFNAVTYMPSRNTIEQLRQVRSRCEKYGFFQISGEDINTPRQNFICLAQRDEEFANLYDAAWALIGHEIEATKDLKNAMFSKETIEKYPKLSARVNHFKNLALQQSRSY